MTSKRQRLAGPATSAHFETTGDRLTAELLSELLAVQIETLEIQKRLLPASGF